MGDVTSHWSDILLDYARAIGCGANGGAYRFAPTVEDEREAEQVRDGRDGFIIVNPCNAVASRRGIWSLGSWATLARALREQFELPILVSGSPADGPVTQEIARLAGDGAIVSVAGRTSVGAFGALARSARAFVGITTGSMHVAAAVGCPTVGIFPFQSDFPDRWSPLGTRTAVVRASYPCHPGDTKESCRDYAYIAQLDVPRILATVATLVS